MIYKRQIIYVRYAKTFEAAKIIFYYKENTQPYHFTAFRIFPHILYDTFNNGINKYYDF